MDDLYYKYPIDDNNALLYDEDRTQDFEEWQQCVYYKQAKRQEPVPISFCLGSILPALLVLND